MKPTKQDIQEHINSLTIADRDIIEKVCCGYRISLEYFFSDRRYQDIIIPKHLLCFYFSQCGYSLTTIAKMLWTHKADHTTVIHGRDKAREEIKRNGMMKRIYSMLPRPIIRQSERGVVPTIFPMAYRPKIEAA